MQASIPRFTAQTELELEKALTAMGITDLFDVSRADLRAMGSAPSGNNLYVSSVLHKTYLSLDENGTRAAAATSVQVNGGSAQPTDVKTVTLKDGRKRNGSLLYTILPPEQAVEQLNRQQLAKAEAAAERRRVQDTLARQAAEAPPSPL